MEKPAIVNVYRPNKRRASRSHAYFLRDAAWEEHLPLQRCRSGWSQMSGCMELIWMCLLHSFIHFDNLYSASLGITQRRSHP